MRLYVSFKTDSYDYSNPNKLEHFDLPKACLDCYNHSYLDERLEYLILSKYGFYNENQEPIFKEDKETEYRELFLCICNDCSSTINSTSTKSNIKKNPPKYSIANNNFIGYIPSAFKNLSRIEECIVSLKVSNLYLSTIIGHDRKVRNAYLNECIRIRYLLSVHHIILVHVAGTSRYLPQVPQGTLRYLLVYI